ncbi:MAG: hypothetical protein QM820_57375 [Minicystis sp.]
MVVTDPTILAKFSFKRTMDQIRTTANVASTETSSGIWKRWMRTFGSTTASGDCNDPNIDPNHYGLKCPRTPELKLSTVNPFPSTATVKFNPVGLFNRFDLAPSSGAHCGEYRIVYAMSSTDANISGRGFIIFEGVLPNPDPAAGVSACLPVAQFWQSLTSDNDVASRAAKLEKFYYTGGAVVGVAPLVQAAAYGLSTNTSAHPAGQVRTDMFVDFTEWHLREFRLRRNCTDTADPATCTLAFEHVTVKVNPAEELFAGTHANSDAFQAAFLNQVAALSAANLNKIKMSVGNNFNEFESVSQASNVNYASNTESAFRTQIASKLSANGSTLTVNNILDRATTQTCAGCHQVSNNRPLGGGLTWPSSLTFVHIDESSNLSPALTNVFLPQRKAVLEKFINDRCTGAPLAAEEGLTLGGAPEDAAN